MIRFLGKYPIEEIEDNQFLLRRVPPWHVKKSGKIIPDTFMDYDASVDWEKYSNPQELLNRLPPKHKTQIHQWKVLRTSVKVPRQLNQQVIHDPHWPLNRSHSLIRGEKGMDVCEQLLNSSVQIC